MYHQFNLYKILQEFFDKPNKKFHLRELSRNTKISLPSVKKHIETLQTQHLIKEINTGLYKGYKSSLTTHYKTLKRNDLLLRLETTHLIEDLDQKFTPNCIILYGSAAEGSDDERGDIDLFIQSTKKPFNLQKYETQLKRKINLLFEPNISKIEPNFKNTLINGIVLRGFLQAV